MSKPLVGIDLGTTYSCVAVYKNGKVDIIQNEHGNRITPSCVAFTDTDFLVGDMAKDQDFRNPTNTIFDVKRLIGRKFNDDHIKKDMMTWPFEVIKDGDHLKIKVQYKGIYKTYSPEEISAMILTKMKEIAEQYIGEKVEEVVVTVPAYFTNSQRNATKNSGAIAGLKIRRIVNEPTAAALAFGFGKELDEERNVLIYDLGGGTFDVSILTIDDGVFEVAAVAGDAHLGGEDFDSRMVLHFAEEFKRKHKKDLMGDKTALRRLRTKCEKAKRTLSNVHEAKIDLEYLFNDIHFHSSITRTRFEELNRDLFEATIDMVKDALDDAHMNKDEIDDIVLVGGSSRIPMVQDLLLNLFDGKPLNKSVSPDEAVAIGAAIEAAILEKNQHESVKNMKLLDVTPLSLGVRNYDDTLEIVIERNTKIPTKNTKLRTTVKDNQTNMWFRIYEGERPLAYDNILLGEFTLYDIPPAPRGQGEADITFEIDENGILEVSAIEKVTSKLEKIKITNDSTRPREDVDRMIREAEKFREEDRLQKEVARAKGSLDDHCYKIRSVCNSKRVVGDVSLSKRQIILNKCDDIMNWLDSDPNATKSEYERKIKELTDSCDAIKDYM